MCVAMPRQSVERFIRSSATVCRSESSMSGSDSAATNALALTDSGRNNRLRASTDRPALCNEDKLIPMTLTPLTDATNEKECAVTLDSLNWLEGEESHGAYPPRRASGGARGCAAEFIISETHRFDSRSMPCDRLR